NGRYYMVIICISDNTSQTNRKYTSSPVASKNVEINGVENTAGSTRIALASRGIVPPTVASIVQILISVSEITTPMPFPNTGVATSQPTAPNTIPNSKPVRTSLSATLPTSFGCASSTASARVTV